MVPKRWARRAVTRNAIKRQIFAIAALSLQELPVAHYVMRLRSGFPRSDFVSASSAALKAAVRSEVQQVFSLARRSARATA